MGISGRLRCMRLRATAPNHVWSYDFVFIRDAYGGKIRMLTMIDEFTRKCLTIYCARRIGSIQVIEQLANAMIIHGIPEYIRSDNGPEFTAKELRSWLSGIGVKTAYIEPGSPWENGFCESFNGTFRDNLLDGETFYSLAFQVFLGLVFFPGAFAVRAACMPWRSNRCTSSPTCSPAARAQLLLPCLTGSRRGSSGARGSSGRESRAGRPSSTDNGADWCGSGRRAGRSERALTTAPRQPAG